MSTNLKSKDFLQEEKSHCSDNKKQLMREYQKDYQKDYKQVNKEQIKEYMRDYFSKQENIICVSCGGHYKKYQKSIHIKSLKHRKIEHPELIDKRTHRYKNNVN